LLKIYFNGGQDGDAVPIEKLENAKYHELLAINSSYDKDTDALIQAYTAATQAQNETPPKGKAADRSKSVYQSRNLGTIKGKRTAKRPRPTPQDLPQGEALLRILRMHPGNAAKNFLRLQFELKDQANIDKPTTTLPVPSLPVPRMNMNMEAPQMGADGQWVRSPTPTKSLSSTGERQ
ncbi:hypothetical protein BC936DRAFT_142242, partial [Jimgerdemannia flammicorona]